MHPIARITLEKILLMEEILASVDMVISDYLLVFIHRKWLFGISSITVVVGKQVSLSWKDVFAIPVAPFHGDIKSIQRHETPSKRETHPAPSAPGTTSSCNNHFPWGISPRATRDLSPSSGSDLLYPVDWNPTKITHFLMSAGLLSW